MAATALHDKPLPTLPHNTQMAFTLSVSSHEHRRALLRYLLAEEGLDSESWTEAIDNGLDEMGEALKSGEWLDGVKQRRAKAKARSGGSAEQGEGSEEKKLERIKQLISNSPTEGKEKHLLLCLAPLGSIPEQVSGFDLVPVNVSCSFKAGVYDPESILFGLDDDYDDASSLIGGTFVFKGSTHPSLPKILRIGVYTHLSLILEQHLLLDSNVKLVFPKPKPQTGPPSLISLPCVDEKAKPKHSLIPGGILSFFSKKSLVPKARTLSPRRGSLDIVVPPPPPVAQPSRVRRFSLLGGDTLKPSSPSSSSFSDTLAQIDKSKSHLSTSPGVTFSPPHLIVSLVAKEKAQGLKLKLKGDERVGLESILGWSSSSQSQGMTGIEGFVRHQSFSVLLSVHPCPSDKEENKDQPTISTLCEQPKWVTYQYYSDETLGNKLTQLLSFPNSRIPCSKSSLSQAKSNNGGCKEQHELRYVHGNVRICITLHPEEATSGEEEDAIECYLSCRICGKETEKRVMQSGTFLLSFGKFLELLVYSPHLYSSNILLCPHTSEGKENLLRHFFSKKKRASVTFRLGFIDEVYELRVPRLQVLQHSTQVSPIPLSPSSSVSHAPELSSSSFSSMAASVSTTRTASGASSVYSAYSAYAGETQEGGGVIDEEKRVLRREIKKWWEGVGDHLDWLEENLANKKTETEPENAKKSRKALPRLPSEDDAYDDYDLEEPDLHLDDEGLETPRMEGLPLADAGEVSSTPSSSSSLHASEPDTSTTPTQSTLSPPKPKQETLPTQSPEDLLSSLRQTFHASEQTLYSRLSKTSPDNLNVVRREFVAMGFGVEKRVGGWRKRYLPSEKEKGKLRKERKASEESEEGEIPGTKKPEWWTKSCHVAPVGNVIVREDDWGSIIAFTMSTPEYRKELENLSILKKPSDKEQEAPPSPAPSGHSMSSSFFAAATNGIKLFRPSSTKSFSSTEDDDDGEGKWYEPEPFSCVVSRKENPRDPSSLLSIREVLRQKSPPDGSTSLNNLLSVSKFSSLGSSAGSRIANAGSEREGTNTSPPSAWSKADVGVSKQVAGGEVSPPRLSEAEMGRVLSDLETLASSASIPISEHGREKTESKWTTLGFAASSSVDSLTNSEETVGRTDPKTPTPSTFNTLTNGLSNAMRYMLTTSSEIRSPSPSNHHALLSADVTLIDDRPHIKYDWTIGKRLKFSCTVYYAKQFDSLRRKCGVDYDVFLKSLARSANWAAEGGKSRSNFWKTWDERFIIKTLVNAWNVADLQVLIDLAPSYFRYIDSTANRATVLAKLIGFYTIEVRNLETGNVQSKADLLVMENLFFGQNVVKTFDLKGIQGRKVKAGGSSVTTKTFFDGEWIEGQQRTLTLVRPHSKLVLKEAVRRDAEFLAKSNIMDYSLLLGIDQERKQIACGLVDTIGSYTFAKTLEYKAKQGLNAGKEVTVIPPAEYQERFVNALDGYFLPCPDKWSKPLGDHVDRSDPNLLPSIL